MDRLTGAGCPTHLTVGEVGQFYENTNTGDIYECRSITKDGDNVLNYAWELRVHGDHVDEHAELFGTGGSTSKYQQPEWGAETGIEVLPEITLTGEEEMPITQEFALNDGGSYVVNWNGVNYTCNAVSVEGVGVLVGNVAAITGDGTDTGEPFVIASVPPEAVAEMGSYGIAMPLDGTTSVVVSIVGNIVHTIPAEYLDNVMRVTITAAADGVGARASKSYIQIVEAIKAGVFVYVYVTKETDNLVYVPGQWSETRVLFNCGTQTVEIMSDNTIAFT